MANIFYSNTGLYTPAATNTILFAQTAGYFGRVLEVSWGGVNSAPQSGGSYAAPIALYATAWNAHGGIGRWLAAPGEEWVALAGAAPTDGIWCNNDQGVTASSATFGLAWSED